MPDDVPPDVAPLIDALNRTRAGSRLLLAMAVQVLQTDGVAGTVSIHLPRKTNDLVEVDFRSVNPHPDA